MTIEITEADRDRITAAALHHVQGYNTPRRDDPRRRYTPAQMEMAIHHAITAALQAREKAGESVEPVAEIVLFGGNLKEVAWRKGKMPPTGTKLYTHPASAGAGGAYRLLAEALAWIENSNEPAVSLCADIRKIIATPAELPGDALRATFKLAASQIERDVRLSELTDEEIDALAQAVRG